MTPLTREAVEAELTDALWGGNPDLIQVLVADLDGLDQPPRPLTVAGAALWYAEQGLHVFPVQPGAKVPFPKSRGCQDGTTDTERIARWWARYPDSNVGIATGHVVDVLDFDGLGAHTDWTAVWGDTWGGLKVLATVTTPRPGGLHKYVPTIRRKVGNRAGLEFGVDYRGLGGYVVAPPSVLDNRPGQHPGTYRFLRPPHLEQP